MNGSQHTSGHTPPTRRITVEESPGRLVLTYRWFTAPAVLLAFLALLWDGAVAVMAVLMQSQPGTDSTDWTFWGLALAAGVWGTYFAAGQLVNRTTVHAGPEQVRIRIRPLPWLGNKRVDVGSLRRIYVRHKLAGNSEVRAGRHHYTYQLRAVEGDGAHRRLLNGIACPEEALYLERALETFLGLPDEPVEGEYRPAG
ncbi:MAG: hypothetical protein ACE5G0_11925 [Rhodothermales bacterium]